MIVGKPEQAPDQILDLAKLFHGRGGKDLARAGRGRAVLVEKERTVLIEVEEKDKSLRIK